MNRITSRLSTERSHDPPATSTESATAAVPRDIRRVSFGCESSAEQCHDAPVNRGSTKVESKETRNASDRGRSHNSRKAGNNEQNRSTSSGCKDSTLSFSDFMAEMMRRWEPPPRYRRPNRYHSPILTLEETIRRLEEEAMNEKMSSGNSEMEEGDTAAADIKEDEDEDEDRLQCGGGWCGEEVLISVFFISVQHDFSCDGGRGSPRSSCRSKRHSDGSTTCGPIQCA